MGLKYNQFGDECESRKTTKGEEICMAKGAVLDSHIFCMGRERQQKRECIGAGATMEGKFWSIFGAED
jgi:hypothetical protein